MSTPLSAPGIAATRLRRGGTNSARGAARFVADALVATKAYGGSGLVTVRADDPKPFIWHTSADEIIEKVQRGRAALNRQINSTTEH